MENEFSENGIVQLDTIYPGNVYRFDIIFTDSTYHKFTFIIAFNNHYFGRITETVSL